MPRAIKSWIMERINDETQFHEDNIEPRASDYSEATWASDSFDRCSFSSYRVFLGGSLTARKTKKEVAVSRSSVEAELRDMALVTTDFTWFAGCLRILVFLFVCRLLFCLRIAKVQVKRIGYTRMLQNCCCHLQAAAMFTDETFKYCLHSIL